MWGVSLLQHRNAPCRGGGNAQALPTTPGPDLQQMARAVLAQTREPAAYEMCRAVLAQPVKDGAWSGPPTPWTRGSAPGYEQLAEAQRCHQSNAVCQVQTPDAHRFWEFGGPVDCHGVGQEDHSGRFGFRGPESPPQMPHAGIHDASAANGFREGVMVPGCAEDSNMMIFPGFGGSAGYVGYPQMYNQGTQGFGKGKKAKGIGKGSSGKEWRSGASYHSASPSTCTTTTGGESSAGSRRGARGQQPRSNAPERQLRKLPADDTSASRSRHSSDPSARQTQCADESDAADPRADTMKAQLQALQHESPCCVFITRRINKLGFSSADQLREYFSRYGFVKNVFVSHSRVKSMRHFRNRRIPSVHWRVRAAALGFVVMDSAEATSDVFRDGPDHLVGGVFIKVQPFHQRSSREHEAEDDEATLDLLTDDEAWEQACLETYARQSSAEDDGPPRARFAPPGVFEGAARAENSAALKAAMLQNRGERLGHCGVRAAAALRGNFAQAHTPYGPAQEVGTETYGGFAQGRRERVQGAGEQRAVQRQRPAASADHQEAQPWDLWRYFSEADLCEAMPDHYRD